MYTRIIKDDALLSRLNFCLKAVVIEDQIAKSEFGSKEIILLLNEWYDNDYQDYVDKLSVIDKTEINIALGLPTGTKTYDICKHIIKTGQFIHTKGGTK